MGKVKKISKEELLKYKDHLTVGKLKDFIKKNELKNDSIVVIERVQDVYYEEHSWDVYPKDGEITMDILRINEQIKSGELKHESLKIASEDEINESMVQYHPAWSCARYKDDKDILFIDLHY